jgi:hypothetical protein
MQLGFTFILNTDRSIRGGERKEESEKKQVLYRYILFQNRI